MRWLGRKKEDLDKYSIEELIVLERFDDAREVLEKRIRLNPRDVQSQVKLADVLAASGETDTAVRLYIKASDNYTEDGFFDKALAVLGRLQKEHPEDTRVDGAMRRVHKARQEEQRRHRLVQALSREGREDGGLNVVQARQAWAALGKTGLTTELQAEDLERLAEAARLSWLERGDLLAEPGAEDPRLFVVLEGELESSLEHQEERHSLGYYKPGEIVGERALFDDEPWEAEYRARRPSRLLALDRRAIERSLAGCSNPRGLLDSLRRQANDRRVSAAVYRILHSE